MGKSAESLGDRMKGYEVTSKQKLLKRTPVIIRVDGKSFHTYTRRCKKPFDKDLRDCMLYATNETLKHLQGFKIAYTQSDEASFVLCDYETLYQDPPFDYNVQKLCSVVASIFTAYFNQAAENTNFGRNQLAFFDARVFNIPKDEVSNYFLWRAKDWARNSLQMYCRSLYTPSELHKIGKTGQQKLLHQKGLNWDKDLQDTFKYGTWIRRLDKDIQSGGTYEITARILPNFKSVESFVEKVLPQESSNDTTD